MNDRINADIERISILLNNLAELINNIEVDEAELVNA